MKLAGEYIVKKRKTPKDCLNESEDMKVDIDMLINKQNKKAIPKKRPWTYDNDVKLMDYFRNRKNIKPHRDRFAGMTGRTQGDVKHRLSYIQYNGRTSDNPSFVTKKEANKKPSSDWSDERKKRKCLMCSNDFMSEHKGNWVCHPCKSTKAWKSGDI